MTDKTEGPAKDFGRAGEGSGPKRPHAVLDLKATEIRDPDPPSAAPQSSAQTSSHSSAANAPEADAGAAERGPSMGGDQTTDAETAPEAGRATSEPRGPAPAPQPSGIGRYLSLVLAGAVGGALAYAGGTWLERTGALAPMFGAQDSETVKALDARLAALESNQSGSASKIDDAERRIAGLEDLKSELASLNEMQAKLAADAKALAEKVGTEQPGAEERERIERLEQRLDVMAAGAQTDDGRLPQLAAISGKIADLQSALDTQIAALRKSIPADIEAQLQASAEAAEAARSGTRRLDQELAQLRTETTRLAQRQDTIVADTERLAASLQAAQEQAGKLASAIGELKSSLEAQLKGVAKPADVSAAIAPVASKVAALEETISGLVKRDDDRQANAERIVLSLELSNLKRALDRGHGYAQELASVQKAAAGRLDLSLLERFKDTGVSTVATLESQFRPVMNAVLDADREPASGSIVERMLAGARSIVRVRKVGHDPNDNSTEAIVGRIERALHDGDLGLVIEHAKLLAPHAAAPMQEWLQKVHARHSVDSAMAAIENQLKTSLSGTAQAEPGARGLDAQDLN